MTDIDRPGGAHGATTEDGSGSCAPRHEQGADPTGASGGSLFQHLRALQELQANLSQEQAPEAILQVGTTAVVEILGADCGVGLVESSNGHRPLRFGWSEGHHMAQHEIEMLSRSIEEEIRQVRSGDRGRVLLAAESGQGRPDPDGEPPAPFQSRHLASVLVMGWGSGRRKEGVLVLGRREGVPFAREQLALADLLGAQIAAQFERVRRAPEILQEAEVPSEVASDTRILRERNQELEAMMSVQFAVGLSSDTDRQIDGALQKAIEVTSHAAGSIYLIVMEPAGEEVLRFTHGIGDQQSAEISRRPEWRRGEGTHGRVWESGQALARLDLLNDPDLPGGEALYRAGYRKMLCLPLRTRGRTIGVLEFFGTDETPYSRSDLRLAQRITDQVAQATDNARLVSDLMRHSLQLEQRLERHASLVNQTDRRLGGMLGALSIASRPGDPTSALDALLGYAIDITGARAGAVHVAGGEGQALRLRAQRGLDERAAARLAEVSWEDPVVAHAKEKETTTIVRLQDLEEPHRANWGGEDGVEHVVVAGYSAGPGADGVLSLMAGAEWPLERTEREALVAIAGLVGRLVNPGGVGDGAEPSETGAPENTVSHQAQLTHAQKMESIGTLAGGIAHNFNNILAGITGHASHIRNLMPVDDPIQRKVAIIEEQSMRAAELTRQLVDFARGGEGRKASIHVNRLLEETVSFLTKSLDPNLVVEALYAPNLPQVEADAGQLRQVLLNIAVNARDAMTSGGRITFQSRMGFHDEKAAGSIPGLGPGEYVAIVISDNGPGMSGEVMERVFEPFFTTKSAGEGTGLGLSVAYGIIKNHRGHVTISSTPGVGTSVSIYLPAILDRAEDPGPPDPGPPDAAPRVATAQDAESVDAGPPPAEEMVEAEPVASAPFTIETTRGEVFTGPERADPVPAAGPLDPGDAGKVAGSGRVDAASGEPAVSGACVLVVDDEEVVRTMAAEILQGGGYRVLTAKDGVEALEMYRSHWGQIAVVLLDMVMPRLGGLETFRRMLGMDRKARVLLYSGFGDSDKAQLAIREGAVGILAKPFGMNELLSWVARALERQR